MAKATISVVGLGKKGSSIGLALKTPELDFEVIGHDKDGEVAKKARARGAVDSAAWNLISACAEADAVILAIPFDQVKGTLKALGQELKPGCVVLDTSPFKQPVIAWAEEYLAEGVHFIGISLGINPAAVLDTRSGPEAARVDLFSNSPCCVMPAPDSHPDAVKLAQDVAVLLGAKPHFMDPAEYDGLSTVVHLMPSLMVTALLDPAMASPSWREMRQLAAGEFLHFSSHLEAGGPAIAAAVGANKESVLYWMDAALAALSSLRNTIAEEAQDLLSARIGVVYEAREQWLTDWELNRWEHVPSTDLPTAGSWFGQLFGFGGRRRTQDDR